MKRIHSIDIMRGLVMILMTLDHTRDLLHISSTTMLPTDLSKTSVLLFFTRWITHLCAPTFVFLSGASAYLSFRNRENPEESRRHLLTRGLWLIVLDLTLVNFGVWFDIHFGVFLFDVLSAIGFGFIVLGLLIKVPAKVIGFIGLAIIFLHNLSPLIPFAETSLFKAILMPFFGPGAYSLDKGVIFLMAYPPVPWLGVMLAGFGASHWFQKPEPYKKKIFLTLGLMGLLGFICIRFINIYGDSLPWQTQKNGVFTFLSFINVTKYPPSLLFCLLTLGAMFVILYFIEGMKNKMTAIATVYGKVPLFFFVVHWYVIHPIMFAVVSLQGFKSSDLLFGFNFGRPNGSGVSLWIIYLLWILVLLILYPVCKWYGQFKEKNKELKWLSYL
jgi:uncharacterized membrane protein